MILPLIIRQYQYKPFCVSFVRQLWLNCGSLMRHFCVSDDSQLNFLASRIDALAYVFAHLIASQTQPMLTFYI